VTFQSPQKINKARGSLVVSCITLVTCFTTNDNSVISFLFSLISVEG